MTHVDTMANENSNVRTLLTPDVVAAGLPAGPKDEVIRRLVFMLEGHPAVRDIDELCEAVLQREEVMSTGVGGGLALPHARTDAVRETVAALGVTEADIEYEAVDELPVRIFFLLAGPKSETSRHIRILSRVSRLMNQTRVRTALTKARTREEILDVLVEAEDALLSR